jgi:hypothetical protein
MHADLKLRTVIWDFGGEPIPTERMNDVARLATATVPPPGLEGLVDDDEIEALVNRAAALVRRPVFPSVRSSRAYPWPLL